ncbi:MAG: hypothetical protein IV090_18765 [Candidatus Sericytochromatia bacterium]|nr:hypothetical protein [Candidatus Sericytochromatia bacterium]
MAESAYTPDPETTHEIMTELKSLPLGEQKEVLDFVRYLKFKQKKGVPGSVLLPFAGTIPAEELAQMQQAIEE